MLLEITFVHREEMCILESHSYTSRKGVVWNWNHIRIQGGKVLFGITFVYK